MFVCPSSLDSLKRNPSWKMMKSLYLNSFNHYQSEESIKSLRQCYMLQSERNKQKTDHIHDCTTQYVPKQNSGNASRQFMKCSRTLHVLPNSVIYILAWNITQACITILHYFSVHMLLPSDTISARKQSMFVKLQKHFCH